MKKLFFCISLIFFFSNILISQNEFPENSKYTFSDGKITINFDTPNSGQYNIYLYLKKKNDINYNYTPKMVSGNIGKEIEGGQNKNIVWEIKKELSQETIAPEYYFYVYSQEIKKNKNALWYGIGAAAVLGGAVAYVLSFKKVTSETVTITNPPTRNP